MVVEKKDYEGCHSFCNPRVSEVLGHPLESIGASLRSKVAHSYCNHSFWPFAPKWKFFLVDDHSFFLFEDIVLHGINVTLLLY